MNPEHKRAVQMLGHCLSFSETDTWLATIDVFRIRLSPKELAALERFTFIRVHILLL